MSYKIKNQIMMIILTVLILAVDYISIVLGTLLAHQIRMELSMQYFGIFKLDEIYVYLVIPFVFIVILMINGAYSFEKNYWDELKIICRSISIGSIASIVLMYSAHVISDVSRIFVVLAYLLILGFTVINRFILIKFLNARKLIYIPVILIGAGKTAELIKRSFENMPVSYYKIIGYIDDNPKSQFIERKIPRLGEFKDIDTVIEETGIQSVLVCTPGMEPKRLVALINHLQLLVKHVAFVPELFGLPMSNITVQGFMEEQTIVLRVQNNLSRKINQITKRCFDLIVTSLIGIIILPFCLLIGLLIYLDSPGPVIYKQIRVGQGGQEFKFYKFRSMVANAEDVLQDYLDSNPDAFREWQRNYKLTNDPRVTRIGKFLRKTSLDELPQLWNVFIGDMSLVGPRPLLPNEIERYGSDIEDYKFVLPGITGIWQVSGRSDTTFEERILMDSWYIHNWSIWIDVVYLMKTFAVVLKGKGAY